MSQVRNGARSGPFHAAALLHELAGEHVDICVAIAQALECEPTMASLDAALNAEVAMNEAQSKVQ